MVNSISVAIIIPVYNIRDFVSECVRSVIDQDYPHDLIECIIVNDQSPDDSIELIRNIVGQYHGSMLFRIIDHTVNKGLSAARNTGIREATTDFVYFLDGDDYLLRDSISSLVKGIQGSHTQMVQGTARIVDGEVETIDFRLDEVCGVELTREDIYKYVISRRNQLPVTAWNRMLNKEFLVENRLYFREGIIHEDQHWLFYLARKLTHFSVTDRITYVYRKRQGSITETGLARSLENWSIIICDLLDDITIQYENKQFAYVYTQINHFMHRLQGLNLGQGLVCSEPVKRKAREMAVMYFRRMSFFKGLLLRIVSGGKGRSTMVRKLLNYLIRLYD